MIYSTIYASTQLSEKEQVMIVGGGRNTDILYPEKHTLVDKKKEHEPDYTIDVSKQNAFPAKLHHKYDVVVTENLCSHVFCDGYLFANIKDVLKTGGIFIMNPSISIIPISFSLEEELEDEYFKDGTFNPIGGEKGLYSFEKKGEYFSIYFDQEEWSTEDRKNIQAIGFEKLIKPWLEENGFKNVKKIEKDSLSNYWFGDKPDFYAIMNVKENDI